MTLLQDPGVPPISAGAAADPGNDRPGDAAAVTLLACGYIPADRGRLYLVCPAGELAVIRAAFRGELPDQ